MSALRDLNILPLIHRHGTKIAVETGLGTSSGVMRLMQPEFGMNLIISVEIDKELVDVAQKFFAFDGRIRILQGHSVNVLKQLLPQIPINMPIFFFLDSHWHAVDVIPPSGNTKTRTEDPIEVRLPLWQELNLIKEIRTNKGARDVIVCDDVFVYDSRDIYDDHVSRLGPNAVPEEQRNLLPKFKELFQDTHSAKEIHEAQGFLILQPK